MDTFRQPTPEEAKLIALRFLGQNLGEIKELDKNIISGNATLRGNTLKVHDILNSIAPNNTPPQRTQQFNHQDQRPVEVATSNQLPPQDSITLSILNKISSQLESIINILEKR